MRNKRHKTQKAQNKGSFFIYGKHAVLAALANPERQVFRLLVSKNAESELVEFKAKNVAIEIAEPGRIESFLPPDATHQGMVAEVASLPQKSLEDLPESASRVVLLDQVTDVHNAGAILRSAVAFGVNAVIITKHNSFTENGALAKAASGALEKIPLITVTNLASAIEGLKKSGFWVLGLDGAAKQEITRIPDYDKTAIIMGAEGRGMRKLTRDHCDLLVKIPISDAVESLNVSNAAAIMFYALASRTKSL